MRSKGRGRVSAVVRLIAGFIVGSILALLVVAVVSVMNSESQDPESQSEDSVAEARSEQ